MSAKPRTYSPWNEAEVARRLPWLLVFRSAVATVLLAITLMADLSADVPVEEHVSLPLYAVSVGIYFVVIVLGMLLKNGAPALILATVHLAAAVMTALMVVDSTGVVESGFSFLYLLAIMDGAIIGGRNVALVVASACTLSFGGQIVAQVYGFGAPAAAVYGWRYARVFVTHLAGFYMMAWLAGHLADLLRSARSETTSAQIDLARAEQVRAVVLESLPLAVLTFDDALVVQTCNAATAHVLGVARDTLVGKRLPEPLASAAERSALAQEIVMSSEAGRKTLSVSCTRLASELEGGLGILTIEDRTQVRALERDLQHKERLASLGTMAAGIAHELRNPLAAISGAVELLRAEADPAARGKLEAIVSREIDRLNTMVNDFLIYARPLSPERQRVNLADVAREVCTMLGQDPKWHGRELVLEAPERLEAHVDAGQMRQVLWNLLRNAVEASPPAAKVELRVARDLEPYAGVLLEVSDEGTGLAPEVLDHLFEPFHTTKAEGTGLGLAVVHRIVEAHGGQIELSPRAPRGTSARVRLPG